MTSNNHALIDDANLHVAKGFAASEKGGTPWKDEKSEQSFSPRNILPNVLLLTSSSSAPPTEVDGDIYLINASRGTLTISSIAWQSVNTVRYSFSGSPDIGAYIVGDYINVTGTDSSLHSGAFAITAFNNGADWIEISNPLIEDNTYDQAGVGGTAKSTLAAWDGCNQNSWVKYNEIDDLWRGVELVEGQLIYDTTTKQYYGFNGTTIITSLSTGTWTTPSFSAGNFTTTVGSFTVGAGDVIANRYIVEGKKMTWIVSLSSVTFASSTTNLRFTIPESKTAKNTMSMQGAYLETVGSVYQDMFLSTVASANYVLIARASASVIANATNAGIVSFTIVFEIE